MAIRVGDVLPSGYRWGDALVQRLYYGDTLQWQRAAAAVMDAATLGSGVTRGSDGAVSIPGTAGWKGVSGPGQARVNGLAMLVRWQPADVQAGTPGLTNAPYAAGFFPSAAPVNPLAAGHALTIANNDAFAGQLGALGVAHGQAIRSVKQLDHDLIAIAGTTGAVSYAASFAGARGYGDRPNMRPIAVDRSRTDATLYAGAYSRGAGARVEEFQTAVLSEYPNWYGTAHAGDILTGSGALGGAAASVGGNWAAAGYTRTATGAQRSGSGVAIVTPGVQAGLVYGEFVVGSTGNDHELTFGYLNDNNYTSLWFGPTTVRLVKVVGGNAAAAYGTPLQSATIPSILNRRVRVEVMIDGNVVSYRIDGVVPSGVAPVTLPNALSGNGVGFYLGDSAARMARIEAHPASVPIPSALRVAAPFAPAAHAPTLTETFDGTGALPAPWVRTRGDETATRSSGRLSAGTITGEDLHYVRPFSGTTVDLFLDFNAPGSSMGDGQGCMATVVAEGDALTVACRAYIQDAQIGNTELEIMSHTAPGVYQITNRVAMALELQKGARQDIRLVYDQARNFYVAFYRGEPVMSGRLALPPVVAAVGVGFGATDTGSTFDTFSAGTGA